MGCGTGALCDAVVERCAPGRLLGVDRSAGFLATARGRATAPAAFAVADATSLPVRDGAFDVAVSGLVLNFVPEPWRMVEAMARALRPGGRVALYVWDYAGRMELMRRLWDAAAQLDPAAAERDEARRFPVCRPDALRAILVERKLDDVEVREIEVPTVFRDFDDFWSPFLGGQGPAPTYVTALAERDREALADRIRERLPFANDGSIPLVARAWAVRGRTRTGSGR